MNRKPTKKITKDDIHASLDQFGSEDTTDFATSFAIPKMMISNNHYANEKASQEAKFYVEKEEPLQESWDKLFNNDNFLQKLQKSSLDGYLGASHFRSVCWRIFWECLSETPSKWKDEVKEKRDWYSGIRKKYVINPHQEEQKEIDLEKHHPLSLAEDSIWNKYFQDNELRTLILQDLDRLHPEIEFFQQEEIKKYLLHILFCYARENPQVSYKQGMHEILSPLIYVMYTNCTAIKNTKESISEDVKNIVDFEFIEHDAYLLFYNIMESIQPWYVDLRPIEAPPTQQQQNHGSSGMFQKPDSKPVNAISNKLQLIQGSMLQKYDPDLAAHLKKMSVTPQVYGIRWVRLLFGREFSMDGLLVLWDAIFADGMALELVEYIYLAMLMHLKAVLLQSDFSQCLSYLMKFPQDIDPKLILRRAVELKQMKNKPMHQHRQQQQTHHPLNSPKISSTATGSRQNKRHPQQQPQQPTTSRHQQHKQKQGGGGMGVKIKPSIHPVRYRLGETEEHMYAQALGSGGPSVAYKASKNQQDGSRSNFFVEDAPDGGQDDHRIQETSQTVKAEFSKGEPHHHGNKLNAGMVGNLRERMGSGAQIISRIPNTLRDAMNSPKHLSNQSIGQQSGVSSAGAGGGSNNSYINAIIEDHTRLQRQVSELKSDLDSAQAMVLYCSQRMEHYLNVMQERMFQEENFVDEIAILGFAGLKQVREILKGQDMDDVDFTDIDRHIGVARERDASKNHDSQDGKKDGLPVAVLADFNHYDDKDDEIQSDETKDLSKKIAESADPVEKQTPENENLDMKLNTEIENYSSEMPLRNVFQNETQSNVSTEISIDEDSNIETPTTVNIEEESNPEDIIVGDNHTLNSNVLESSGNPLSESPGDIGDHIQALGDITHELEVSDKADDRVEIDLETGTTGDDESSSSINPDPLSTLVDEGSESVKMVGNSKSEVDKSSTGWVDPLQSSDPLNSDTDA
ncbi:TBC1 domain family member 5-like isoform X2 [Clytia hemisphaerica]|uniref:TBC1 domain family member 5-like isoform X2 n=1 Tax=Clytia hemisphaerica TaxID=252671 RepID=UPI0034D4BF23